MDSFWIENLVRFSIQIGCLLALGGLAIQLFLRNEPAWRLWCWQALLAICLCLPLIEPWQPDTGDVEVSVSSTRLARGATRRPRTPPAHLWTQAITILLSLGIALRLSLFALGLLRLRHYRRCSLPATGISPRLLDGVGAQAGIRISEDIPAPVTFGLFHPVVLLPSRWLASQSVLYHELLHVRRRDWLFMVAEEIVRAVFWFHPLIWYAIAQIQLAREQVVDREVVRLVSSREQYLETLLAIAASRSGLDLAPAPLFLRKRHLRKRVASLMNEVPMSRHRLQSSLAGFLALTLVTGYLAVRSFPLHAAPPQDSKSRAEPVAAAQDSSGAKRIRVGGNAQAAKIIHKVTPVYPRAAKEARLQGVVRLNVLIAADGSVKDIEVIDGAQELVDAAVPAVRQWIYETTLLNGEPVEVATTVDVNFTLSK